jgi:hypothetical protein
MTNGASPVTFGTTSGLVYERVTPGSTPSVYAPVHTAFAVKTNPRAHNPNRSRRETAVLTRAKYLGAVANPALVCGGLAVPKIAAVPLTDG